MKNYEEEKGDSQSKSNSEMKSSKGLFGGIHNVCDNWFQKVKNGEIKRIFFCCMHRKPKGRKNHVCSAEKYHYQAMKKIYEENIWNLKEANQLMRAAKNIEKSCFAAKNSKEKMKYRKLAMELKESASKKRLDSFRDASDKLKSLEEEIETCNIYSDCYKPVLPDPDKSLMANSPEIAEIDFQSGEKCQQKDNFTQYEFKQKDNYKKKQYKMGYPLNEADIWEMIIHKHLKTCSICKENNKYSKACNESDVTVLKSNQLNSEPHCTTNDMSASMNHFNDYEFVYSQTEPSDSVGRKTFLSPGATPKRVSISQGEDEQQYLHKPQGAAPPSSPSQAPQNKYQKSNFSSFPRGFSSFSADKERRSSYEAQSLHPQSRCVTQPTPIKKLGYRKISRNSTENGDIPFQKQFQASPQKCERLPPLCSLIDEPYKQEFQASPQKCERLPPLCSLIDAPCKQEFKPANGPVYTSTQFRPESRFLSNPEPIKKNSSPRSSFNGTESFQKYSQAQATKCCDEKFCQRTVGHFESDSDRLIKSISHFCECRGKVY